MDQQLVWCIGEVLCQAMHLQQRRRHGGKAAVTDALPLLPATHWVLAADRPEGLEQHAWLRPA